MSDNYEKFDLNNDEPMESKSVENESFVEAEPVVKAEEQPIQESAPFTQQSTPFTQENTANTTENASYTEESAPATPEKAPYTPVYSDSTYRQPKVQPERVNPYESVYRSPDADTAGAVNSAYAPNERPKSDFNNGYYHYSYARPNNAGSSAPQYGTPAQTPPAQNYYARTGSQQPPTAPRAKKKSGGLSKGAVAILLVVCILVAGLAGFGGSLIANQITRSQYDGVGSDTMVIHKVDTEAKVAGTENLVDKTTSEITSEVADTVVEITTEVMQTSSYYGQYVAQGAGSGVIISDDGYILTNNHVIEGASSIKVTTRGGDTYDATIKGLDAKVDIALLKIEATDLPTAVFGDSSKLEVGAKAVIIGNPLGTLGGSVTEGIISALDRSIDIDGKTMHLIQTDASVNPGNSGGGMFNGQGELTGIVVAKSASEEIDNIGFVIPINNVLSILGDLKDYGYVRGRADTGMEFIDLSNQMYAWYYYGSNETGVYVSSITSGSNAEKAGFRKGDRIVSVDGTEIKTSTDVESAISEKSAGDKVSIVVSRNGREATIDLELEEEVPDTTRNNSSSGSNGNNGGNSGDNGGSYPGGNPFSGLFGW